MQKKSLAKISIGGCIEEEWVICFMQGTICRASLVFIQYILFVIHLKYFSVSDWLKSFTKSTRTRERGSMRNWVMEIEQETFTPLVFTTTGGMADECVKYHSRLAELIANEKGESYSSAISWIRAKVSFAIVRSAILCLRGSRSRRRQLDFVGSDLQIENIRPARIKKFFF